jgi:uncharacterized protein (DUF1810 family)
VQPTGYRGAVADLQRFRAAQDPVYPAVLGEIRAGDKRSHWMWFVFPQIAGLGSSPAARLYAIGGREEARAYLGDPVLAARLRECAAAVLAHDHQMFDYPDDLKLRSSMTLFARVADDPAPFEAVLAKFFGSPDPRTLELLDR